MSSAIVKVEPKDFKAHPEPKFPTCPQHEFTMLLIAPKGSGKTNLICNLLLNHYKGYFHQIWVCSPSVDSDEKWDVVKKTKHILVENKDLSKAIAGIQKTRKCPEIVLPGDGVGGNKSEYDKFDGIIPEEDFFECMDDILPRVAEQKSIIESLKKQKVKHHKQVADRILVILDDQAGAYPASTTRNPMSNFVIKHRHHSISCIFVTQAYKMIPRPIRVNCNCIIAFRIPNLMELKMVYEENPEGLNENEWMEKYNQATEGDYDFLYINNKFPKNKTIFQNMDIPLFE